MSLHHFMLRHATIGYTCLIASRTLQERLASSAVLHTECVTYMILCGSCHPGRMLSYMNPTAALSMVNLSIVCSELGSSMQRPRKHNCTLCQL